jgi:hypothetical protein
MVMFALVLMPACADSSMGTPDTIGTSTTAVEQPATLPTDPGFRNRGLRCDDDEVVAEETYDFFEDVRPYLTNREAFEVWQLGSRSRWDWDTLSPVDALDGAAMTSIRFADERGWVQVIVEFVEVDEGRLVGGYRACAEG